MRIVRITKQEFDYFLFPAWAQSQNPADPELVVRVTRLLKAISNEKPLDELLAKQRASGKYIYAERELDCDATDLMMEEDEWKCLRNMFKKMLPGFSTLAMEDAYNLYQRLENAKVAPVESEANKNG